MEVLVIFAIVASIISSVMKAQQKNAKNQPPRVREAPAPEAPKQTAQVFHSAPHVPIRSVTQASPKQDVARDSAGTIKATDRVAMVSRLTDTAAERAALKKSPENASEAPFAEAREADDDGQEAFRRDILRGVVMSEILTRPQQRKPVWRRT